MIKFLELTEVYQSPTYTVSSGSSLSGSSYYSPLTGAIPYYSNTQPQQSPSTYQTNQLLAFQEEMDKILEK